MEGDKDPKNPAGDSGSGSGNGKAPATIPYRPRPPPQPSLVSRPSSELLGNEGTRVTIVYSDWDTKFASSEDSSENATSSLYSEEDDNDREGIIPPSLTKAWGEKKCMSGEHASSSSAACASEDKKRQGPPTNDKSKRPMPSATEKSKRRVSISTLESQCSHCGHRRGDSIRSSVTLANMPLSPTSPLRDTTLLLPGPVRMKPQVVSQSGTQRSFPLIVRKVPSRAMSEVQTFYTRENKGQVSEQHSEAASIISSIFATPLRHLASHQSLKRTGATLPPPSRGKIITPVTEQRHPGKEGARISRFTRLYEPSVDEQDGDDYLRHLETLRAQRGTSVAMSGYEGDVKANWVEGWPLSFLTLGICLVVFLISVDRTIITTAIPDITAEFRSTTDIGWYGSAYLLTACAFQPVFGRVFMLFSVKWPYIFALLLFLAGSLVCGMSPNSLIFIIGRAVAGLGSAGILTGSFVVVATAVPFRLRPIYTAIVGLMFGFGATVGPILGGIFTDLVTWRWCFYMNLPIGGLTIAIFLLFFHPKRRSRPKRKFIDRILELDIIGNILLLGACMMLFLALEYTTQGRPWSDRLVIILLSGSGGTALVFAAWQWWKQDGALIPPSIIMQRTVAASCVAAFTTYGALLIHSYFLPIWFQAIRGESAISSGVDMIPYVATNAFFSLVSGVFVSIVGYFVPPAVVGGMIATAGCGILRLLSQSTPTAYWIGFEVLVAAGFGMSIQQGFTAVQAVLSPDEISIGTAAIVASQSLGGAIFLSVGNTLFQNHLMQASAQNSVPGVDIQAVLEAGATAFENLVPASSLPQLLIVYNEALRVTFTVAIPLAGVAAIAACFMEWKSVKERRHA